MLNYSLASKASYIFNIILGKYTGIMYNYMHTLTKGHVYSPVESFLQCYCNLVLFLNKYEIRSVNILDFRFKLTAILSDAVFRYLILGTLNILWLSDEYVCKMKGFMQFRIVLMFSNDI